MKVIQVHLCQYPAGSGSNCFLIPKSSDRFICCCFFFAIIQGFSGKLRTTNTIVAKIVWINNAPEMSILWYIIQDFQNIWDFQNIFKLLFKYRIRLFFSKWNFAWTSISTQLSHLMQILSSSTFQLWIKHNFIIRLAKKKTPDPVNLESVPPAFIFHHLMLLLFLCFLA